MATNPDRLLSKQQQLMPYSRLRVLHSVEGDHGGPSQTDVVLETDPGAGHLTLLGLTANLRRGKRNKSGHRHRTLIGLPRQPETDHVRSGQVRAQIPDASQHHG